MSTSEPDIFRRRTAIGLAILCFTSLLLALILSALSDDVGGAPTAGASAVSRSAIGYQGLVRFLNAEGVAATVSRHGSAEKAGPGKPLLLADPPNEPEVLELVIAAMVRGAKVIVVLPKWTGRPARLDAGWIERAELRSERDVNDVLAAITDSAVRADSIVRLSSPPAAGFQPSSAGDPLPTLPRPQLIRHGALIIEPLVSSAEGILVGTLDEGQLLVIADPDLLNNSGLGQGDNAVVVQRLLVDRWKPTGIIVDETIHGFTRAPSLWGELFQFPLVLVPLHLAGLLALLLATTMGRFGKPEPLPPRILPGKLALVDNTAELLGLGGFSARSLLYFAEATLRQGAAACALPPGLETDEQLARLAEVSRRRGLTLDIAALHAEAVALDRRWGSARRGREGGRRILDLARALYRWRQEIMRGQ